MPSSPPPTAVGVVESSPEVPNGVPPLPSHPRKRPKRRSTGIDDSVNVNELIIGGEPVAPSLGDNDCVDSKQKTILSVSFAKSSINSGLLGERRRPKRQSETTDAKNVFIWFVENEFVTQSESAVFSLPFAVNFGLKVSLFNTIAFRVVDKSIAVYNNGSNISVNSDDAQTTTASE